MKDSDCLKLEAAQLEHYSLGRDDTDVDVRYFLRTATRGCRKNFEVFNVTGRGEHVVASKVRWDEGQRLKMSQVERMRRECLEFEEEECRGWAAADGDTAKRILKFLEDSENLKVSTREQREQVLFPEESGSSIIQIARQAI